MRRFECARLSDSGRRVRPPAGVGGLRWFFGRERGWRADELERERSDHGSRGWELAAGRSRDGQGRRRSVGRRGPDPRAAGASGEWCFYCVGGAALGSNPIDVVASAAGSAPASQTITVTRLGPRPRKTKRVRVRGGPPLAGPTNCGAGLAVGAHTSCAFAENVRAVFEQSGSGLLEVYSPTTGRTYRMYCTSGQPTCVPAAMAPRSISQIAESWRPTPRAAVGTVSSSARIRPAASPRTSGLSSIGADQDGSSSIALRQAGRTTCSARAARRMHAQAATTPRCTSHSRTELDGDSTPQPRA